MEVKTLTGENSGEIRTEGIKYTGSKLKILPEIMHLINHLPDVKTVIDGFSGSTRISQALALSGYNTTANDVAVWSEVLATCYLKSTKPDKYYREITDHLNALPGHNGWFTEHYGAGEEGTKKPFQIKNTRRLDSIREEIDRMGLIWEDKCVILTSLIYALDKVDNTLGHYAAYLNKWSKRSYNDLTLKLPRRFPLISENIVTRGDIFDTIEKNEYDLAYFDPPYGSSNIKMPPSRVRYASYYHIWTTIVLNDKPPLFGRANRRTDSRDGVSGSVFEEFRKNENGRYIVLDALEKLFRQTKAHYILLSYSSGGRATKSDLTEIIMSSGKLLKVIEIDYARNVMSDMRWTNEWTNSNDKHKEYLLLTEKTR